MKTILKYLAGFIMAGIAWDIIDDIKFKSRLRKSQLLTNSDVIDINRTLDDIVAGGTLAEKRN